MKSNKKTTIITAVTLLIIFLGAFAVDAVYQYKQTIKKIDEQLKMEYQKAQSYRIYQGTSLFTLNDLYNVYNSLVKQPPMTIYDSNAQTIPDVERSSIFTDPTLQELEPNEFIVRTFAIPVTPEGEKYGIVDMRYASSMPQPPDMEEMREVNFVLACDKEGDLYFTYDGLFYYYFNYRCCFRIPEGMEYCLQPLNGSGNWRVQGETGSGAEDLQKKAESISKSNKKSGFSGSDRYLVLSPTSENLRASLAEMAIDDEQLAEMSAEDIERKYITANQYNSDEVILMDQILFYDWTEEKDALVHDLTVDGLVTLILYIAALGIVLVVSKMTASKAPAPDTAPSSDAKPEETENTGSDKKLKDILDMIDKIEEEQGANGYLEDIRSEIKAIRNEENKS